ncbi:MAG: acyl-CoA dehydrogenase [Candidatus Tectimicrobiota bacterium]|nr:MAG: acyl-CoA dehydrogenase [Candidatus Tectomicrobia bacterium]
MIELASALHATRVLAEALERGCERTTAHLRRLTEGGSGIDAYQVPCERLAYRATELQAIRALLAYATALRDHGQEAQPTALMALAYAAGVYQKWLGEVGVSPDEDGLSEAFVQEVVEAPAVRQALRLGGSEALLRHLGREVMATGGVNTCWLGDELAELTRQSVRDFAQREVEPLAEAIHRQDALVPDALIAKMGELGYFAMSIPEAYGGTGMGLLVMILTTEELSRASLGAAGSLITRPEIVARALLDGGTEAQKRRWLPRIASGELMVAVSVTEPDVGSDVAALTCRAQAGELEGQPGYFISGTKAWCTFAGRAELIGLLARTDPDVRKGARGLSLFIVEKERCYGKEFCLTQPHGGTLRGTAIATLGYRGMHSFTLYYDNYFVPAANLVGEAQGYNRGFYLQMRGFASGRLQTGGRAVGLAQAALEKTTAYVKGRVQFGRPVSDYGLTQYKLGCMATQLAAARQLTYRAARAMERDPGMGLEAAMAKLLACDVAVGLTQEGQLLHGGWGYAEETPIARYVVDALVLPIFEGVKPILELKVIARQLLR